MMISSGLLECSGNQFSVVRGPVAQLALGVRAICGGYAPRTNPQRLLRPDRQIIVGGDHSERREPGLQRSRRQSPAAELRKRAKSLLMAGFRMVGSFIMPDRAHTKGSIKSPVGVVPDACCGAGSGGIFGASRASAAATTRCAWVRARACLFAVTWRAFSPRQEFALRTAVANVIIAIKSSTPPTAASP
jgi:hypothetical protein